MASWNEFGPLRCVHSHCPRCRTDVFFVMDNFVDSSKAFGGGSLFCSPGFAEWTPDELLMQDLCVNPEVAADYMRGVDAFNRRDAIGIVSSSRRLLEGLVDQFIPVEKQSNSLAQNLPKLQEFHSLADVLKDMSNAIKDAGNIGVHFGASRLTAAIASSGWALVNELLRLHFQLETRVATFKAMVEEAKKQPIGGAQRAAKPEE